MKTTLIFLFRFLFLTAFIRAGQPDQTPFDVVSPQIPDRLCRVTLNRQELGGEIDRRIRNLIDKNYMVIDLDVQVSYKCQSSLLTLLQWLDRIGACQGHL